MRKILPTALSFVLLISLLLPCVAHAQGIALTLRLSKVIGYNGFDGAIQGTFKLKAQGPATLEQVSFYIDGNLIGTVEQPPFELQFSTGDHDTGIHTFSAQGTLSNGQTMQAEPLRAEIITAAQARRATLNLVLPILLLSLGAVIVSALFPLLAGRKANSRPTGSYGAGGGAVCPRCLLPFSRHVLALNLLAGKLERCPHCGKWSVVARAAPAELSAAEDRLRAERQSTQGHTPSNAQDRRQKRLEDTRFEE